MTRTIKTTGKPVPRRISQIIKKIPNLKALTRPKFFSSRINPSMLKTSEIMRKTTPSSATSKVRVLQLQDSLNLCQERNSMIMLAVFSQSHAGKTTLSTSLAMVKFLAWVQANRVWLVMEVPALVIHPKYWSHCEISALQWLPVVTVTQWYWPIKVSCTHGVVATRVSLVYLQPWRSQLHPRLWSFSTARITFSM